MGSLCAAIFPQVGTGYKALQRSVLDQIKLTETKIKPYLSFCLRINITRTLLTEFCTYGWPSKK